ncbi:MAG: hypothetical protein A3G05_00870 [Candidatus Zambryskibacteria bacterium RIFCSPLOWO2_12_FULL_45_14]|uniref:Uncharacterized protein n=2 Tax=Candidatus Zambryskiibacteriota TaxID=1817925 RepID=A0A1G2UKA9_9BACT|nr:MAG: hypothetical protein A3H60_00505 [Candidatus Zambryskibacteria bacterium RIFCSPLOWO2_02_FULL_44_12b]OHB13969.1 MAG: hypothetical protein A3G05_00870 [Candidatus Zambryskibacteria bacterium RIFCSPLOWO2_12_FULL_45_14]
MNRFKIQDSRLNDRVGQVGFRNGIMVLIILTTYFLLPTPMLAQTEYTLLAPLPLDKSGCTGSANEVCKVDAKKYIEGFFTLMIAIAGGLAVLVIIFGGIKYMSTDAFSGKSEAKQTIEHAIWGLLLAISAWLILNTINPNLVKFNFNVATQPIPAVTGTGAPACSTCVTFASLGIPTSGDAVGASIAPYFGDKLVLLNNGLRLNNIAWSVTEGYPPSVTHVSACHNSGTCVDANIANPSAANINKFFTVAAGANLAASYEVLTDAARQTLINAGVNPLIIRVNAAASGPHFHVK